MLANVLRLASFFVVAELCSSGTSSLSWQPLGDGSLEIHVPARWIFTKQRSFESETYEFVDVQRQHYLGIYLGSTADVSKTKHWRRVVINGINAREGAASGGSASILYFPKCGHDRLVWIWRTEQTPSNVVQRAMHSLRCAE